jgi:hypothetical protein
MANVNYSTQSFGKSWVSIVQIDSSGTVTPVPAGTNVRVHTVSATLTGGTVSPNVVFDVTNAAGTRRIFRGGSGAGGGSAIASYQNVISDGLAVTWVSEAGTGPQITAVIEWSYHSGDAPTPVFNA